MKIALVVMTGLGFTLGVVLGLLLQLPSDSTLSADSPHPVLGPEAAAAADSFRSRRSLSDDGSVKVSVPLSGQNVGQIQTTRGSRRHHHHHQQNHAGNPDHGAAGNQAANSRRPVRFHQLRQAGLSPDESAVLANAGSMEGKLGPATGPGATNIERRDNPISGSSRDGQRPNNAPGGLPREDPQLPLRAVDTTGHQPVGKESSYPQRGDPQNSLESLQDLAQATSDLNELNHLSIDRDLHAGHNGDGSIDEESPVRLTININTKDSKHRNIGGVNKDAVKAPINGPGPQKDEYPSEQEDIAFLQDLVKGVTWTPKLESSCPRSFHNSDTEAWRRKAGDLDVVKMEVGCGRMQNRLLTFRDASKACARYRLNTDQIQGEIFSYYLSKLLNISNIPPTLLVQVNSVAQKWRTVHLDMSLAHWADNKLVVLTQYIPNLSSAYIPVEFRGEGLRLEPTLSTLGNKSPGELCELLQWSDLVILDYLTANLDRVINNMFNKQWNDQMMSNPAHNLEKFQNGALVFLDNESGLFHGYRLLEKYSTFHQSLLQSVCVFRESTVNAIKRLHKSKTIGADLHALFEHNEAAHKLLAGIPEKNVKVLQRRLDDVHEQILKCEQIYGR